MSCYQFQCILVAGASAGIGAATARLFAKYKARLALHGRNVERLTQVAQECRDLGLKEADVSCIVILITFDSLPTCTLLPVKLLIVLN